MAEHPLSNLVSASMDSIKGMIDVNTIVGEPVETPDGSTIIPISRVSLGYGAGGGDYALKAKNEKTDDGQFGGGVGAGVSINPVAFLVIGQGQIKLLPLNSPSGAVDKLVDYIPFIFEKINGFIGKKKTEEDFE